MKSPNEDNEKEQEPEGSATPTPIPAEREGSVQQKETKGKRLREAPVGILRLDSTKPRRSSTLSQIDPPSPQPSVDRLSVTFAEESVRSDSSTRCNLYNPNQSVKTMDKLQFPEEEGNSDEEDYSMTLNTIMLRRASTRKSKKGSRRPSSPFTPDVLPADNDRRRSSVFTTSSADTAITVDESLVPEITQDQIFENIKLHKEVLSNVKMQPWNMRKKLRLVMQAKSYIKRHEGALQERFTQSHSIKDMLARWNIIILKKWQRYRREVTNLSNWFLPWEFKIKEIESHFGSVVASYFIFLRWLFCVNMVTSAILMAFVAIPEIISTDSKSDMQRKQILPEDKYNATNFLTIWDFEGVFKYTPLFYGWYTNKDSLKTGYRLPLAYFVTELVVYIYSFVATLRKMAENSRMSKLSEKGDECIFTWKLFTGWDFMIGNAETAQNRAMSIVMAFKEALLEEAEKKRNRTNWKIISIRLLVNTSVLVLFALSAAAVVEVVRRSTEEAAMSNIWRRNEITVVMTLISLTFPMLLEWLGYMERYHPRKQLRIQLARIMMLNLLNLYALIFAQFVKIDDMTQDLQEFKNNTLKGKAHSMITTPSCPPLINPYTTTLQPEVYTKCYDECINVSTFRELTTLGLASLILSNISTTTLPKFLIHNETIIPNIPYEFINNNSTEAWGYFPNVTSNITENYTTMTEYTVDANADFFNYARDKSQDYLDYILSGFEEVQNTTTEFSTTFNSSETNSTTFDFFKSTFAPILNMNTISTDDTFLTEIFEEISTTIATNVQAATTIWQNCTTVCEDFLLTTIYENATQMPDILSMVDTPKMSYQNRTKLRSLCWETMFGQELVKLTIMDFIFTVLGIIGVDFFRGIFVRVMNPCWCWDLEKKFPEYGEFKVAENILHLVYNQGMVWMGMFFSPGIVLINTIKLVLLMYMRSWAVLTCNVPHAVIFRASRSNNFYFALLITMLFLCVLPVGYAIVWVEPSWHCGPFSNKKRIYDIFTKAIRESTPISLRRILDYIVSPGIVIPLLVLLILVIYYLLSLTSALREANIDLKVQLRQERTEERRKMFKIADRRRRGGSGGSADDNTPFGRWKKLLNTLPTTKSLDEGPKDAEIPEPEENDTGKTEVRTRALISKFIKRALRRSSATSEEESAQVQDDTTDTEQHESLPEDIITLKDPKRPKRHKSQAQRSSSDSVEKRVQIVENEDDRKWQDWRKSGGSKASRQDSNNSNWSDNIPVITISKTESAENILDDLQTDKQEDKSSGSETLVTEKKTFRPRVKHTLRKQDVAIEERRGSLDVSGFRKVCPSDKGSSKSNSSNESKDDSSETTKM